VAHELFVGPDLSTLMARARAALGPDAVVLSVRRAGSGPGAPFELAAADPATAALLQGAARPRRVAPPPAPAARESEPGRPAVIVLVGPTGSGKTTTIAKLANHPKVLGGRRVGLLSLDTYRIGAVEQSRIYAQLSGLPIEVVYESGELPAALRRLRDCEVVLVDTPGRGPNAHRDRDVLREQIAALRPFDVHLTLPAGLHRERASRVIREHRELGITHLLITKVDECREDDVPFELALESGLPVAWLTDGQEVPADLKPAGIRLARVARRLHARESTLAGVS
jgi:flagellar biosynthesis protein FlhF